MGRQLVLILLSLTLSTCSNSYNDEKIQTEHSNNSLKFIGTLPLKCDSAFIQGTKYLACSSENKKLTVTNSSGDTVYKHAYFCARAEFLDFDNDNSKDILFHYLSNVGGVHDLALFDTKTKTFILVDNLSNYPEPIRIDETKYYYSYHRSGCADSNWDSDLFYIDNFKTHKVGNIAGRDCNDVLADVGIFISKISSTKTIPYDTLEIDTIYKYQDDKWDFIADYWTKNYRKFVGTKKNGL